MKTFKLFSLCLVTIFVAGLVFTSCKKKEETTTYSYRAAQDNSTAEGVFNRSYSQISKAARHVGTKSTNDTILGCPTLYISGAWPDKIVTLDFGTSCQGDDGVFRRGKIVTHINGLYIDSTTTLVSTFDNYFETINGVDYQVQGTQTIVNLGHNASGHPHFSVDVQGASVTSIQGTISWTSQRENEWTAGYDTWINPFDDEYLVTGSANGTDVNGAAFTVTITSPLLVKCCTTLWSWIIASGTLDIVNAGYPTITVDYGDGSCDFIVYVIINGTTYTYVLA
ncbi:MAG: hypothetical protein WCQ95_12220 [Bacteroidota bacterium]